MKFFVLVATGGMLAWILTDQLRPPPQKNVSSAPTIENLKPLAGLTTTRVEVTDALTVRIAGKTGELRAAVIVHGDAMLTIDLTKASIEQVDHNNTTAVVVLPRPHVVSARVDHERTRIFAIETSGLWSMVPGDDGRAELIDQAMREAQAVVRRVANEEQIIERARERAETLICSFMKESLNWSFDVRWIDQSQN